MWGGGGRSSGDHGGTSEALALVFNETGRKVRAFGLVWQGSLWRLVASWNGGSGKMGALPEEAASVGNLNDMERGQRNFAESPHDFAGEREGTWARVTTRVWFWGSGRRYRRLLRNIPITVASVHARKKATKACPKGAFGCA